MSRNIAFPLLIEDYQDLKEIGRGSYGVVFSGYFNYFNQATESIERYDVALKVTRFQGDQSGLSANCLREIATLRTLGSDPMHHIVKLNVIFFQELAEVDQVRSSSMQGHSSSSSSSNESSSNSSRTSNLSLMRQNDPRSSSIRVEGSVSPRTYFVCVQVYDFILWDLKRYLDIQAEIYGFMSAMHSETTIQARSVRNSTSSLLGPRSSTLSETTPRSHHASKAPRDDPELRARRYLPKSVVKSILYQLLVAVKHAHSLNVLHRDIKPDNILLFDPNLLQSELSKEDTIKYYQLQQARESKKRPRNQSPNGLVMPESVQVYLGDFGLARFFQEPSTAIYTHEIVTLHYRPPEILLGIQPYSTFVDIWSIGCIFAELVNFKKLFDGDSEIGQLMKIFRLFGTPSYATSIPSSRNGSTLTSLPNFNVAFPKFPEPTDFKAKLADSLDHNLDEAGLDLLSSMLKLDPTERISASEALTHRYFSDLIDHLGDDNSHSSSSIMITSIIQSSISGPSISTNLSTTRLLASHRLLVSPRDRMSALSTPSSGTAPTLTGSNPRSARGTSTSTSDLDLPTSPESPRQPLFNENPSSNRRSGRNVRSRLDSNIAHLAFEEEEREQEQSRTSNTSQRSLRPRR
jgi:serine/threonine protein kinase